VHLHDDKRIAFRADYRFGDKEFANRRETAQRFIATRNTKKPQEASRVAHRGIVFVAFRGYSSRRLLPNRKRRHTECAYYSLHIRRRRLRFAKSIDSFRYMGFVADGVDLLQHFGVLLGDVVLFADVRGQIV
jgi:hypothetical protein